MPSVGGVSASIKKLMVGHTLVLEIGTILRDQTFRVNYVKLSTRFFYRGTLSNGQHSDVISDSDTSCTSSKEDIALFAGCYLTTHLDGTCLQGRCQ